MDPRARQQREAYILQQASRHPAVRRALLTTPKSTLENLLGVQIDSLPDRLATMLLCTG